jgi:fatty acid desaturase
VQQRQTTTTDRPLTPTSPPRSSEPNARLPRHVEWPTIAVALAVWMLLVGAVVSHPWLPWWLTVPLLAIGSGWFASLQHEVAHGHPTPWPALNVAIAGAPIGFVYPFSRFTELHLAHHRDPAMLTEPGIDNESRYCSPEAWARAGRPMRLMLRIERTLAGHLTIGVVRSSLTYVASDLAAARADRRLRLIWARHLVGVAVVVALIMWSGLPFWQYLIGVVYGRVFFTGLRVFAEHRGVSGATRSAVVRAGLPLRMIFLNNNLHHTHHASPGVAWYRLPALHEDLGSDELARHGAGLYTGGYLEVARRFGFRPFCQPVHPAHAVRTGVRHDSVTGGPWPGARRPSVAAANRPARRLRRPGRRPTCSG